MLFVYNGYERVSLEFHYLSFTFIQSIVLAPRQYRFSSGDTTTELYTLWEHLACSLDPALP